MDIWLAIVGAEEPLLSVIGAYSSKELAEKTARQACAGEGWETLQFVIDEVPDWVDDGPEEPDADEDPQPPVAQDQHEPT